jgi:hypothetical protein
MEKSRIDTEKTFRLAPRFNMQKLDFVDQKQNPQITKPRLAATECAEREI